MCSIKVYDANVFPPKLADFALFTLNSKIRKCKHTAHAQITSHNLVSGTHSTFKILYLFYLFNFI